jgi:Mg-chelatase subunit ChlD
LTFAQPWWFLALATLLVLPRGPGRPLRATTLALAIVALAGPEAPRPIDRTAVIVDVSDSARAAALDAAQAIDDAGLPPDVQRWFAAGEAGQVGDLAREPDAVLDLARSDLGRALARVGAEGVGRILLISDGLDTRGGLADAGATVPVDVVPVAAAANARLEGLDLPVRAAPGASVRVSARVRADRPGPARLQLRVGGEVVATREVTLSAASRIETFDVRLPGSGPVRIEVGLEVAWPQPLADDALVAQLDLERRDPLVVVGDPALAALLRTQGFDVEERGPAELTPPFDASAIVIRAPSTAFTASQLDALAAWVDDGGGLAMTGGPESFGLGGWFRTPVEAVLPVDGDLRSDVRVPLVAMVMVLDRSQSMAAGSPSKLSLARQGAAEVVDLAFERDLLGLIAFSDERDWVFDLRPATARGKLEMLSAIRGLTPSGGTVLGPALTDALDALRASDAAIKHIVVLSDGRLYDGEGPFGGAPVDLEGEAAAARADGITISTIAVGAEADFERLEALARAAGGRYYEALDVATLPRIFAGEALTATRSLVRRDPGPPQAGTHPLLAGVGAPPAPDAYVATTLKDDAEALWSYGPEETLLAVRRQGLGRTAAFTGDLNAWAGELGGWPDLATVLSDLLRWLAARPDRFAAQVEVDPTGGARLLVDAVEDGRFLDGLELVARSAGETLPLRAAGPGRYEADLPPGAAGEPVVVAEGSEVVARTRFLAQDPEFRAGDGRAALERLAALSGGEVLAAAGGWRPAAAPEPRSLASWFLVAALATLLAELVWRRVRSGR